MPRQRISISNIEIETYSNHIYTWDDILIKGKLIATIRNDRTNRTYEIDDEQTFTSWKAAFFSVIMEILS
jgi:hypothetical protein